MAGVGKVTKWEVTFFEIKSGSSLKYKGTRRLPEQAIAETKIFVSKAKAKKQFEEWLK